MPKGIKKCDWEHCPVRVGFEIYFQGEPEEKQARKNTLPLIKRLFNVGQRILTKI